MVFEADDAGGCGQWHVLVEQLGYPAGQGEVGAAIAPLPAGGTTRGQESGGVQQQVGEGSGRVPRAVHVEQLVAEGGVCGGEGDAGLCGQSG